MLYRIGNKVKIIENLEVKRYPSKCYATEGMVEDYVGKEGTVVNVTTSEYPSTGMRYRLDVDDTRYSWSDEMLLPALICDANVE
jgi:hypothetical protein